MKLTRSLWYFKEGATSHNIIFTLRAMRPSVRQKLEVIRRGISGAKKHIQPDTSAPTNRIAAGDFIALSRWDVVNTITLCEMRKDK
ncbi:hypothetical protein H1230_06805 [Paenibacillus sp. 19GGS1-52]|uniref:hypothetical protein n=1 Tax=Paenibacillus sp. 19GGS1-52 TaxID=2758563 RepID=UPI001EFB5DDF|nr:hypothetical protein [Paenibacillus sp. 19GGS1-52]ULO08511.1 hypothetical protein H1230_06805 [Paenibacillus sp. 19GGS1-52]